MTISSSWHGSVDPKSGQDKEEERINSAQFISFGFSFSICYGTSVGLGRHEADIPPQWHVPLKKSEYVFSVLYVRIRPCLGNGPADRCRILR